MGTLRSWHSANAALARSAVIAQLHSHMGRLRTAPQGTPSTCRAFRVGAELADIVASMAADATEPVTAQRYFVLAVQLAHVAGDDGAAESHITRALALRSPGGVRNRIFDLIGLARVHVLGRDADRATGLIDEVLPLAVPWASGRVGSRLVDFHCESAVLASNPTMRGIRDAIIDLVPAHHPSRGTPCA